MRKFFQLLWRVVTFPFLLVFNILAFPFRMIGKANRFLNAELPEEEDRPLMDTFSNLVTEEQARESLWNHVEALRMHLLRIVIALVIGVGASFYFTIPLMDYLSGPVGGLEKLQAIQVTEEIGVFMQVALTSGLAIMLPYIAFEIWLFIAPGLRPRERKMGLAGIPLATILYLSGMAFTFYALLPYAIPFLGGFTKIAQFWAAREYFKFVTGLMLWIGLFFEFPLVVYILTSIGLVKPSILAQQWRLAVVIIAIIAAAVTPTVDAATMGLVMVPLTLLYFISIGLSYIAYAGRRKRIEESASEETKAE
ncbi:MAG: twin-arginine translocase subunit TatC [Anaerolineales bacterium]|nr:twin-arginine translocase subunit TatC [Anaerolineales bacterium]